MRLHRCQFSNLWLVRRWTYGYLPGRKASLPKGVDNWPEGRQAFSGASTIIIIIIIIIHIE